MPWFTNNGLFVRISNIAITILIAKGATFRCIYGVLVEIKVEEG